MKKLLTLCAVAGIALLSACGSTESAKSPSGKIKLQFQPENGRAVAISYWFSVNNTSSDDVTTFDMKINGRGETGADGTVTLEMKNMSIKMSGKIGGKEISGSAEGPDSVSGDAKLVALPVFTLLGKSYKSTYNSQLEKKTEIQVNGNEIVDSTENKLQFLLQYPSNEVAVGDSWNKELAVKMGNKMICSAKYTLKEIKGDTAVIVMDGKLSGSGDKFGNEYTMEGKMSGDFEVDIKTGWPVESDAHQEFILKIGGKEIPMLYDIKCRVKK